MKKKYCSRCGNLIDRETKKCTGCGKQYCRGIRFTKFSVTILVLSFFLVALLGLNIFQLTVINAQPEKDVDAIEGKESSVVKVFCYDHNGNEIGTGSGVILFHDDMVVTNYHVVEDAYSVKVSTDQDITYKAAGIWHKHVKRDIAILKLETGTKLSPLEIVNSLLVKKGEEVTVKLDNNEIREMYYASEIEAKEEHKH